MDLTAQIEALLFYRGEPVSYKELGKLLSVTEGKITGALAVLKESLKGRGIQLIEKDNEVMLATAASMSDMIEKIRKEELTKDLGKAGAETLAIILYRGPSSRSDVDYIRGVNSTFILRNLLIRGLVERVSNPDDQRSYVYKPTFELLSYLGVKNLSELPQFAAVRAELDKFTAQAANENNDGEISDAE